MVHHFTVPCRLAALPLALALVAQAHAASSQGGETENQLQTIEVTATADEGSSESTKAYTVKQSSSATKLNITTQETPQTINVVTRQQMDDFGLTSTRDVLANTPGVTVSNQETERTTYLARGFEISNILVDGVGFPSDSYNYNDTNPDSFFYDRIEVVKGADALTNGFGDPSATINYIRKRPTKTLNANAGISYGSWDTQRYEADVSGPLNSNGRVRGRLMGYEQTGNSYLDKYSREKNGLAGIIEADLTDSTLLTAGYSYEKNLPNANNWGALPLLDAQGKQISYQRSYNPVPDWAYWNNISQNGFIELKQKLGQDWIVNLNYSYAQKDRDSRLLYYYGYPQTDGSGISLTAWGGQEYNTKRNADLNVQGVFDLLGQQHEAIFGYSHSQNHQKDRQSTGLINDSNINNVTTVYDGISYLTQFTTNRSSWTPASVTWSDFTDASYYTQNINSWYAATRLHLNDDLKFTLGANYVEAKSKGMSYGSPMNFDESKVTPYTGLTYNFSPEYTGYLSYTSIFRPQTTLDAATGQVAKPIEGDSYEAGIKSAWLDNRLTGTLAIFRTEESNYPLRSSDGNPLNHKVLVSDLRSQGVEVGLAGKLNDNTDVSFGFAQFNLTDLKNGGDARTYNPSRTVNLTTTYTVPQLPALKVGGSLQWQDKIYRYDNTYDAYIRQESYALLGLMANYAVNDQMSVQVNGYNLGNKKYLNSFTDGQAYYGAPANYTVALKFKY